MPNKVKDKNTEYVPFGAWGWTWRIALFTLFTAWAITLWGGLFLGGVIMVFWDKARRKRAAHPTK